MTVPAHGLSWAVQRWALVALTALILSLSLPGAQARIGRREEVAASSGMEHDNPLTNVQPPADTAMYQQWQGAKNDTLQVYKTDFVVRFQGERFIPFQIEDQQVLIQAAKELAINTLGPVELKAYKENYPDRGHTGLLDSGPAVDVSLTTYWVLNKTKLGELSTTYSTWEGLGSLMFAQFVAWSSRVLELGKWSSTGYSAQMVNLYSNLDQFSRGYTLHPIVVLCAELAVRLKDPSGRLSAEQATAVGRAAEKAVVEPRIGTLVEVTNYTQTDSLGRWLVDMEITLFVCRENATVSTPECEQEVLCYVLEQLVLSEAAQQRWQEAGIENVDLVGISVRQPPKPPPEDTVSALPDPLIPWHLDRIDQQSLPLDGNVSATASGTGVNLYLLSTGVRADHEEFKFLGDMPGSRIVAAYGQAGGEVLDPLSDCLDHSLWYGYGTHEASLAGGLRLGVAKNVTIHSVRFRNRCMGAPDAEDMIAALDYVLANHTHPAVVLINTWWAPKRLTPGNSSQITEALLDRLDRLEEANITVVVPAGPHREIMDPCDNIFASHSAPIRVAGMDVYDQSVYQGPRDSLCIDIWAPGSGLGGPQEGASPSGRSKYTRVVLDAFGAAPLVAGVAAQYLQLHPTASGAQVKAALLDMSTPHVVTGSSIGTTNLLFTNLTEPQSSGGAGGSGDSSSSGSSGGGGLSTGAVVAVVVAACFVAALAGAGCFVYRSRRMRRQLAKPKSLKQYSAGKASPEWEISSSDISICLRPDGSEWLLGEGAFGKVYKALKDGVQVVAVKKWSHDHVSKETKQLLLKEIEIMKFVSRDANVTQFFGVCVEGEEMMLVTEYMEGGDLREALSRDGTGELQWYRRGKEVMLDVVRGVHFLHSNKVIHRDIKSKNILLSYGGRAKVADVGLAKLYDGQESAPAFVGTLPWAAPELLLGESCSERADIFSLGVVLWELVTREVPLRGRLREPIVPIECPGEVADIIHACLQRDPALRPDAKQLYSLLLASPPNGQAAHASTAVTGVSSGSKTSMGSSGLDVGMMGALEVAAMRNVGGGWRQVEDVNLPWGAKTMGSSDQEQYYLPTPNVDPRYTFSRSSMATIDYNRLEFCTNADGSNCLLGCGSFGSVYKVMLDGLEPLAAKVVDLGGGPGVAISSFLKEAETLWRLRHQHLVTLMGVSVTSSQGVLLMELMDGSLHSRLSAPAADDSGQRLFSWYKQGRQVATDVAKGIRYLHSMQTTHFDLKSANILFNSSLQAKIADVGLARVLTCTHHSLSYSMGPPGTFAFMAPELLAGSRCTEKVDLYSFGIILWEICTGEHAFAGTLPDPQVPEQCPQAVLELYKQCTAPDPSDRPTAREVEERLYELGRQAGFEAGGSGRGSFGTSSSR